MILLKNDIIGSASKIVYGRKGDKVKLKKIQNEMMLVENSMGICFYINCYDACVTIF
jgi:hypothetical protein